MPARQGEGAPLGPCRGRKAPHPQADRGHPAGQVRAGALRGAPGTICTEVLRHMYYCEYVYIERD